MPLPSEDAIANALRGLLGAKLAYAITRRKNIIQQRAIYRLCQAYPRTAKRVIRYLNARLLPKDYPVDEHFKPAYNPWDQRLCVVPDGDLFKAISAGHASVVTDRIATFTERGIKLESGRELEADIIVTATGLNLQAFGGVAMTVDGDEVNVADKVAFKSMMLDGVPNFAFTIGYINSSWTLKVGPVGDHFTRLLAFMDANGHNICYPQINDPQMATETLWAIGSGYVKRSIDHFPRQGADGPWRMTMDYNADAKMLREGPVDDENLRFTSNVATSVDERDLVLTA
jgi:monooxygenase